MKVKRFLAIITTITLLFALVPTGIFAAVPENQRPNNPTSNLTIGILNDSRADGHGEFPNEPSVTGYTYYYLRSGLNLSSSWFNSTFSSNAENYINTESFWNDERIVMNSSGNAFGFYSPTGLDLENDTFFTSYTKETIYNNKAEIIRAYLDAEGNRESADNYDLLFYVLKYETGYGEGYHLDAKVIAKNDVILSYDANRPEGVNTDIILPSSSSVAINTTLEVSDMRSEFKSITSSENITYEFKGWNTAKDGSGTDYSAGDDIVVAGNTTLYAQWRISNTYEIVWVNYNDAQLFKDSDLPYGTKIGEAGTYYNTNHGANPTRPDSAYETYTFSGWELVAGTYDEAVGLTSDLKYKATYTATVIKHKANVEVILNGTFDSDGNYNADGSHIDIETVTDAQNKIYLKKSDGTGEYIVLEKEGTGVYGKADVQNGDYYIYIYNGEEYVRVGTQELTIQNADRVRYLPYYSVKYFDGVVSEPIETEYYYIGSRVDIIKDVPERDDYVFTNWDEGGTDYSPSTDLLKTNLTEDITEAHELTAEWVDAATVNVTVVANHNGRTSVIDEDLTIHLTTKNIVTGNYNEVSGTTKSFTSAEWYDSNTVTTTYNAGTLYTNLSPNELYGAHAAIPGYKSDTGRSGGAIEITNTGTDFDVTIYLIYDPVGYELPFTVNIAEGTPERMIPKAVDIKVTRYNAGTGTWDVIVQHVDQSVEVEIDKNTRAGSGSVHVWGFENEDTDKPYLYRIKVVRIDLGDYQLTSEGTDDIEYTTQESGFFPSGAYKSVVDVINSDLTGGTSGLPGGHANSSYVHHGSIVATVSVKPYKVVLNPDGGKWDDDSTASKEIEDRFTVPDLSGYIPVKEHYTFDGWYLDSTKFHSGEFIKDYVSTLGGTLELTAKWKENIKVKGMVIVDLGEYACNDDSRVVSVALQKKENGIYSITSATQSVALTPYAPSYQYAVGEYEFDDVEDSGDYRINVFVTGGGMVSYQNEPESRTVINLDDPAFAAGFNATDYTAVLDGDKVAVVNVYMTPTTFELGYMGDASEISEYFRPTDIKFELRHDHLTASGVEYAVIKNTGLGLGAFDNVTGLTGISTVDVPPYHANGRLYDYVMPVLSYDIEGEYVGDVLDWDDRHYYHDASTPGYTPAPFSIAYEGPAEYRETPIVVDSTPYYQDVILKAIFTPNTYTITYDLKGGSWQAGHIGPSTHKWSFDTVIPHPIKSGYTFTGWTIGVAGTFDAEHDLIPANIWQDVTLAANWKEDKWSDAGDKTDEGDGIPDEYQALLIYEIEGGTWNGTDNGQKHFVVTIKEKVGDAWVDISPAPTFGDYTPDTTLAAPDASHEAPAVWTPSFDPAAAVPAGQSHFVYKFTPKKPEFTFNANGGAWENAVSGYEMHLSNHRATYIYNYNDAVSLIGTNPVRTGYTFDGWYSMDDHGNFTSEWWDNPSFTYNITDDISVYAKWSSKAYTVHYDLADGTLDGNPTVADNTVHWEDANLLPAGTLAKPNHIFTGWVKDTTAVDNSKTYAELVGNDDTVMEITLVAQWSYNGGGGGGGGSYKYTLTYETNGGTEYEKEKHKPGTTVEINKTPEKEDYIFEGWYEDEELTKPVDEVKMTKNITVFAKWVKDNGSAGTGYNTPGSLNGEDHFAYVMGYPDGTVRPDAYIDRAEVTTIFFRLLKEELRDANLTDNNDFSDVKQTAWHNKAISTMTKLGIVKGRAADKFVPDANITRAEFATICARFDDSEFEIKDNLTDVKGHWAEADIHEAATHGWIRGYEDGTFKPDQFITRAEAMTMINRVLNRVPETYEDLLSDMVIWPDNSDKSHWYYLAIQEATNSHKFEMKNHIYEKWTALRENADWTKYQ